MIVIDMIIRRKQVDRMGKHNPVATANAVALTVGLISTACALGIVLLPEISMAIAQSWFHGLDISKISSPNVTVGSFVLGLTSATALSWPVGYVFASIYNLFVEKSF